jgi:Tripartite tricarboxylate transporter TctB family
LVTSAGVLFSLWRRPEQIASTAPEKIQVVEIIPEESDMIYDVSTDFTGLDPKTIGLRGLRCLLLLMLFFGLSYLVGIIAATPLFLMIYLISHRESWKLAVPISVIFTCVMYLFFEYFLRLAWPVPALAF